MCGICGYTTFQGGKLIAPSLLREMNGRIIHRGPDGEGFLIVYPHGALPDLPKDWHAVEGTAPVGLAMRRLAIIDLVTGDQPIANEDGTIWIVYNGEAYNHAEWRAYLQKHGHRFRTQSDTETVIHLYEEFGEACVTKINGMFAFAIWDGRRQCLFLARDRVGIKPLHYATVNGDFFFGSEIKSILAHPAVSPEVNYQALDKFLHLKFVPSPHTIFEGIQRLPPGHTLTVHASGRIEKRRYWDLRFPEQSESPTHSFEDGVIALRTHLRNAVQRRLMSDVPLGAFLSGGIDSSIIVGLMSELMDQPVQTFSMGFEEPSFNELQHARQVARHFHTDHHEFLVSPQDALDLMRQIVRSIDEPFGDASAIPTFLVSQATRQHVTVALSGIGADEAFAGYERYWVERFANMYGKIPALVRRGIVEPVLNRLPVSTHKKSIVGRGKRVVAGARLPIIEQYVNVVRVFNTEMKHALYTDEMKARVGEHQAETAIADLFEHQSAQDFVNRAFYADLNSILTDDYLVKDDRMSMANSLEVRVPFLDHRLLEFAATLPSEWRLKGFSTKHILKKAYQDFLPQEILQRGKFGFEAPIGAWFRGDLWQDVQEILLGEQATRRGLFNPLYIEQLLEQHRSGIADHKRPIWCLVMLEIWYREYLD